MPPKKENVELDGAMAAEDGGKEKTKRKIPPLAIYAVIGLVMIVAGYFVGTNFLRSSGKNSGQETAGAEKKNEEKKAEKKTDKKEKSEGAGSVVNLDDIIVNPAGTAGTRFLSVSIGFEIGSPETAKLFEDRQPLIRDALITILGSKTIEQLSDPKQKEITRYQIKKRVEQLLKIDDLAAVYFTDFILQ
jgi:flagellar protein FliL